VTINQTQIFLELATARPRNIRQDGVAAERQSSACPLGTVVAHRGMFFRHGYLWLEFAVAAQPSLLWIPVIVDSDAAKKHCLQERLAKVRSAR
jgi:hypothetical protein